MSNRRILIVVKTFLPVSETFILDQIAAMQQNYEVHVVCSMLSGDMAFPEERLYVTGQPGKTALMVRKLFENGLTNIIFQNKKDRYLLRIIDEVNPACMVVHFGTNLMFNPFLKKISIPVCVWFHGYDASGAFHRYGGYRKILLSMLDQKHIYPVFVSKGLKDIFESHIGWEIPGDIHYLGISLSLAKSFQKTEKTRSPNQPYHFLQAGRLVEKKGHLQTLEALHTFRQRHPEIKWKYTIIGSGPMEKLIEQSIIRLKLQDHILMLPEMPRNQLIPFLMEADLFLQHSITGSDGDSEGMSVILMEAMLMEMTVISTRHSGIIELIEDKKEGYLCNPEDISSYADGIYNGISKPLGSAAKQKIERSFDNEIHQLRFFEWLERRCNLAESI